MERRVRTILQATFLLALAGIATLNAQPTVVTNVPNNSTNFATVGDLIYFTSGQTLWRTDGTASGTLQLSSGFDPAYNQGALWKLPQYARAFNGNAYLVIAETINSDTRSEIWRSDGTSSGTFLLKASSENAIRILDATENYLFFTAYDEATGTEVYRTDGTPGGTVLLQDLNPGSGNGLVGPHARLGNEVLFAGNDGVNGTELWKTDGTTAGTVMVEDSNPGPGDGVSTATNFFTFNDRLYFGGNSPDTGFEPFISDGTAAGTHVLQDINTGPDSSTPLQYAIANNGYLYFLILNTYDDGPSQLWKTAGTDASTSYVKLLGVDGEIHGDYHSFLVYNDKVYFWDRMNHFSDHLWVTDGTSAGTYSFFDFITIDGSVHFFEVVNDYMLFAASVEGYPTNFYRSDGTTQGTRVFAEFRARGYLLFPRDLTKVGDLVFYADHDGPTDMTSGSPHAAEDAYHLFQADGDTTRSMRTMWGVNTLNSDNIEGLNGNVVFTANETQDGTYDPQKKLWIYDPRVTPPPTASFILVSSSSDEDLKRLLDGSTIAHAANINIRYNPKEPAGSVVFKLNGSVIRRETAPPYSMAGDVNGDYAPWQNAAPGTYTLTATPYSGSGGTGTPGEALTITFTIDCPDRAEDCINTGEIRREEWTGIPGNSVASIPVNTRPDRAYILSQFEGPLEHGTNYGARFRGFIHPPATGNYTFWIASNDNSELWLSTDDDPANKVRIAFVNGATGHREWNKFASQRSAPVTLTGGVRYYIEALHKQGVGTDNIAVGWQLSDGTMERPIPGRRLSAFQPGSSTGPTVSVTTPTNGQTFSAPADILIEADAYDGDDGTITLVEFYAGPTGETGTKIGEDASAPYSFVWEDVPAGNYDIYAFATDTDRNKTSSSPVNVVVNGGSECMASGTITRDYWANVSGDRVSDVPVNSPPTTTNELTIFEAPSNIGDRYATRIRGYICPPVTGSYNFWIASNDHSELWLSTDDDPANKVRIAWVTGATNPRQWNKFTSQVSPTITLIQGQRYYIEAVHKESVGTDHIAVGWQLPGGELERPIPGSRLSPFNDDMASSARLAQTSDSGAEGLYSQISIYPNPATSNDVELKVGGYDGITESVETEIQIMKMTGEVVFADRISCGGDCSSYLVRINKQLVPGLYMVNMKTNGTRSTKRLLVK